MYLFIHHGPSVYGLDGTAYCHSYPVSFSMADGSGKDLKEKVLLRLCSIVLLQDNSLITSRRGGRWREGGIVFVHIA